MTIHIVIGAVRRWKVGEVGMKKDYIVELREEEADELMDEHWVGELIHCKDCKHFRKADNAMVANQYCRNLHIAVPNDWFCADGERKESDGC